MLRKRMVGSGNGSEGIFCGVCEMLPNKLKTKQISAASECVKNFR